MNEDIERELYYADNAGALEQITTAVKRSRKKFAIGRFPDGMHGNLIHGPFDKVKQATNIMADEGEYMFVLQIDRPPKVIMWWNDETLTWERFE